MEKENEIEQLMTHISIFRTIKHDFKRYLKTNWKVIVVSHMILKLYEESNNDVINMKELTQRTLLHQSEVQIAVDELCYDFQFLEKTRDRYDARLVHLKILDKNALYQLVNTANKLLENHKLDVETKKLLTKNLKKHV